MRISKRYVLVLFAGLELCLFLAATVKPAHAYVDPGSGLLFFQVAGSMLAGALFVMRTKVRKLFGLKPPAETNDGTAAGANSRTGTRG